jgi:hypothetical protein
MFGLLGLLDRRRCSRLSIPPDIPARVVRCVVGEHPSAPRPWFIFIAGFKSPEISVSAAGELSLGNFDSTASALVVSA